MSTEPLTELRQQLGTAFTLEELRGVCFDLGLDYDDLSGDAKNSKIIALLNRLRGMGRVRDLLAVAKQLRPNLDWRETPTVVNADCPFKGLAYYAVDDADVFFGREALTAQVMTRLRQIRFLAIIGASGSGKSSLARAGVIASLWRGTLPDSTALGARPLEGIRPAHTHILTPTDDPLAALSASLTRDSVSLRAATQLADDLASDPRTLSMFARRWQESHPGKTLVLLIDQFEEVFTQCHDEAKRTAFVDALAHAAGGEWGSSRLLILLTLRADFYAKCAPYAPLRALLQAQQEFIGPMAEDELRRTIQRPAELRRLTLEPGLIEQLLHNVGHEPGALPLLSHALLETWRRRSGSMLTFRGYHESGSLQGAIAQTAQHLYDNLPAAQQEMVRRVFVQLTELGEGTQDTRRRVPLAELFPQPEQRELGTALLTRLADERLVVTSEGSAEVAHEALIREWGTLRAWLEADRESERTRRRLSEDAREWLHLNRDIDVLYRGVRLAQAREWAADHAGALGEAERTFLKAAVDIEERKREEQHLRELEAAYADAYAKAERRVTVRLRMMAMLLATALVVATVMAAAALFYRQSAIRAEAAAVEAARELSTAEAIIVKTVTPSSPIVTITP